MRRAAIALALFATLAIEGCRGGPAPGAEEAPWRGIALDLAPDPARSEVAVRVRVSADHAARVRELSVARAWADTRGADGIRDLRVEDEAGALPVQAGGEGGPDLVFTLSRPPRGGIDLRYRARANVGRSRFALRLAGDRMSGVGHAFLLLPRLTDRAPSRVHIEVGSLGRGADAASSLGFGETVTGLASSEDLGRAAYVAGKLWREEAAPGAADQAEKSLLVLGDPPFDTRRAFERSAAAAAAIDRFFGGAAEPMRFIVVAQRGLGAAPDGAWLGRSLGAFVDTAQPLDGALTMVIGHELSHRYLGGTLRFTGADGRELTWFSEGFTVHLSRRALFEAGLLSAEEHAADLTRTLGPGGDERIAPDYRRGAMLGAWLDAEIRRASAGARSLAEVVRALVDQARAGDRASLPLAALREALAKEIGAEAAATIGEAQGFAAAERAVEERDDLFGPCARRRASERRAFDLGFDRRSLAEKPALVRGVVKGSAADRAGLAEGALVLAAKLPARDDPAAEVDLSLANGRRVRYRPVSTRREVTWEAAPCALRAANK